MSEDPIGFSGADHNLYRYLVNSPIGHIDPYGLASCSYTISTGVLGCVSNDGSTSANAQMFSGINKYRNRSDSTNVDYGPITQEVYEIIKVPGKNPRDWFLDPGFLKKIGYRFGLSRGAFMLHLRTGVSQGCITADDNELDIVLQIINNMLNQDAGNNTLTVVK